MHQLNLQFVKTLQQKKITFALAESVTCGLAAQQLSTCKGVMDVLKASIVCYTAEAKIEVLGVSSAVIKKHTCESKEVTAAMVKGLKKIVNADVYAAITGLASPGGSETEEKPVGTVFFAFTHKNKLYQSRLVFNGSPLEVRKKACLNLYEQILKKFNQ